MKLLNSRSLLGLMFYLLSIQPARKLKNEIAFSNDLPPKNRIQSIPKTFHFIWIDFGKGNTVFEKYEKNISRLMDLHPNWTLRLWKEDQIVVLIKKHFPLFLKIFNSYDVPIKKHDAARIIILCIFGGVYLDHDFIALKNIEPLLKSYSFVVGNESETVFTPVNGFLACTKNNGFMKYLIRKMSIPSISKKPVLEATGPSLLKNCMITYYGNSKAKGLKVYSRDIFYPIGWWESRNYTGKTLQELKDTYKNSYLLQEYDASWKN